MNEKVNFYLLTNMGLVDSHIMRSKLGISLVQPKALLLWYITIDYRQNIRAL